MSEELQTVENQDLLRYVMCRAARMFGSRQMFNAASFACAFSAVTGIKSKMDGLAVRAILYGRNDVKSDGYSHYRIKEQS